jgi:hypothetical protein
MKLTLVQVMNRRVIMACAPFGFRIQEAPCVQTPNSVYDLTTSLCDIAFVELGGKAGSRPFQYRLKGAQVFSRQCVV